MNMTQYAVEIDVEPITLRDRISVQAAEGEKLDTRQIKGI